MREVAAFLAADPALAPEAEPVAAEPFAEPPRAPWVRKTYDHYLIVSDLQIPFSHARALDFCQQVRREYNVPQANILCVGDEVDQYWASAYPKDPDAQMTAGAEIDAARRELARWYLAFPEMRICDSNHGGRWAAAAKRGGIPSQMMRDYREVLQAPPGWRWGDHWIIKAPHPFRVEHGHKGPGGQAGLRNRPLFRGISTAWGHEHANPACMHVEAGQQRLWAMRVGSLMTQVPCEANAYEERNAYRPTLSVGVVLDGGRTPLVVPMEGK